MGFLKWVSNIFGRGRDDTVTPHGAQDLEDWEGATENPQTHHYKQTHQGREGGGGGGGGGEDTSLAEHQNQHQHRAPALKGLGHSHGNGHGHRRGFSMPIYMAVDKPQLGPLIVECPLKNGGVQGLDWCGQLLLMDEDGDVAHEFYEEKLPSSSSWVQSREEGGSMRLGNHMAIEKQRQQSRGQGLVKVNSAVRPANVRRVDSREGQVVYLVQDSDRKCHWAH